jgi:3',5'-nucleoside bisphosphate phosphatase
LESRSTEPAADIVRVDLHCHSSVSDGDLSPEHLARTLAAAGVACAALTDHNSLAGQERFRVALKERGIPVVTGLEMDARSTDGPVHLLAYGFDPENEALLTTLHDVRCPLRSTARYWFGRARSLKGRHSRPSAQAVTPEGECVPHGPPITADAIRLIHEAGGRAVLAHPLAALPTIERLVALLDRLQAEGLDGLEVFHKPYPTSTQGDLLAVARRRGLLVVAGSDFHGPHHTFGASPGVDMPREYWERFARPLGLGRAAADPGSRPNTASPARRRRGD